ncbi:MAG: hypothetical protein ABW061_14005, partial [Polyangiaceae bacterium]
MKRELDCSTPRHGAVTQTLFALACAALLIGCPLDTRPLELAPSDAGGSPNGGATGNSPQAGTGNGARAGADSSAGDAGAGPSAAGSGAQGGQSEPLVGGCADLNMNQVPDCTETAVTNPDMKEDVAGWVADPDTSVDWNDDNAWGDTPSGSALVASSGVIDANAVGAALRAAAQCVPITGKKLITVFGNAFVDANQDPQGHAEIDVFFFDQPACAGSSNTGFSTPQPLDASVGNWLTLKAGSLTNESTRSILVKLAISKP